MLRCLLAAIVLVVLAARAEIINPDQRVEDHCHSQPCGEGNTCFSTLRGFKCFCRPGDYSDVCTQAEQCLLYNHTGICRGKCNDDETGFIISHLGSKFLDLVIYNKDGNMTVKDHVPVGDIKEQEPCMWQLTGKADCCVPTADVKIGCFAYGSTVLTSRGVVAIEDVRTGDQVESVSEDGEVIFSDVIMIMHQEPDRTENMVVITTEGSAKQVTATHDHLMYVKKGDKWEYIFSELVEPGMLIQVADESGIRTELVQSVTRKQMKGLYAPVTMTGTIIVDSVLASCYGNHPDHFLSHMVFAPIRWVYNLMPWLYNGDAVTSDGSHPYVSFLNKHLRALTGHSLVLNQHRLDAMTVYP